MFFWVESQSTSVIALIVFLLCYLLAAGIYFGTATLFRSRLGAGLRTASPSMFVSDRRCHRSRCRFYRHAGLGECHVRRRLPRTRSERHSRCRAARRRIARPIAREDAGGSQDIPQIRRSRGLARDGQRLRKHRRPPPGLTEALNAVLAAKLTESGQVASQQRIIVSVTQALDARRHRVLLSEGAVPPIQWLVILILDALMLTTIRFVHAHRAAAVANMLVFSTAIAACILLLMASDRPFSSGGVTLDPGALREVGLPE